MSKCKKQSLKGRISESHLCVDCGYNTAPGVPSRAEAEKYFGPGKNGFGFQYDDRFEMFIVHDHVWQKAGMEEWGGCLCVGCLERRIGRRLIPADFPDHPFKSLPGTPRLLERQGRYDPLGEWVAEASEGKAEEAA
jgi:hypothetical protein